MSQSQSRRTPESRNHQPAGQESGDLREEEIMRGLTCAKYRRQPPVEKPPAQIGIKDSSQLRTAEARGKRPPSVINGVSCPAKTKHCS